MTLREMLKESDTKARAAAAAIFIRRGRTDSRAFADCFEMGDGDEVVKMLLLSTHPKVTEYARRAGWAK